MTDEHTEIRRRRGIFLLPNLLTTCCLFGGFYAIVASIDGNFERASIAVFVAMIFDGLDGRVARLMGTETVFGKEFDTTGYLGVTRGPQGDYVASTFPQWMMLPGPQWLSMARSWHFFFAWLFVLNGLAFIVYALASRHLTRDLAPTRDDLRGIGASIRDHLRFKHPTGEAAKRYNVLQKLAYLIVVFFLLPLIVLMGFAMSPWLDAILAGWVDIVGGRQSARSIHFIIAWLLVAFVAIHVFQVIVTGLWNNLRSMITGRYKVPA